MLRASQSLTRKIRRSLIQLQPTLITRTDMEHKGDPYHLTREKRLGEIGMGHFNNMITKANEYQFAKYGIKGYRYIDPKKRLSRPRNKRGKQKSYGAIDKALKKIAESVKYDAETQIPIGVGFDHIIKNIKEKKKEEREGLGEFTAHFEALVKQLKMRDKSELLFLYRTALAKGQKNDMKQLANSILTQEVIEATVPDIKKESRMPMTEEEVIDKIAYVLMFKKIQRERDIDRKIKENKEPFRREFWEKDPLYRILDDKLRYELRSQSTQAVYKTNPRWVNPDFSDFDWEGLAGDDFSVIRREMQETYFEKKMDLLPEVMGVDSNIMLRVKRFFEITDSNTPVVAEAEKFNMPGDGKDFIDRLKDFNPTEEEIRKNKFRKKASSTAELDNEYEKLYFENPNQPIQNLEEFEDFTSLKEILYSFNNSKTLENKILRLERDSNMLNGSQPEIIQIKKQLDMLIDKLPSGMRKYIDNGIKEFEPKYLGIEHRSKDLSWKIIDDSVSSNVFDYADTIYHPTHNELFSLSPELLCTYWAESFPFWNENDIVKKNKMTEILYENTLSSGAYNQDLWKELEEMQFREEMELPEDKQNTPKQFDEEEPESLFYSNLELNPQKAPSNEFIDEFNNESKEFKIDKRFRLFDKQSGVFLGHYKGPNDFGEILKESITHQSNLSMARNYLKNLLISDDNYPEERKVDTDQIHYLHNMQDEEIEEINEWENTKKMLNIEEEERKRGFKKWRKTFCHVENEEVVKEVRKGEMLTEFDRRPANLPLNDPRNPRTDPFDYNAPDRLDLRLMELESDTYENLLAEEGVENKMDKQSWKNMFTNETKKTKPFDLYTDKGQLDKEAYAKFMRKEKIEDLKNFRDFVRWMPDPNDEFFKYMKMVDIRNFWGDDNANEIYMPNTIKTNNTEIKEPMVEINSIGQQLKNEFLLTVLQTQNLRTNSANLTREQSEEVTLTKNIRNDPYHKHYLNSVFKNVSKMSSEILLSMLGNPKNPDLGFLIDSRICVKKMFDHHKKFRSPILNAMQSSSVASDPYRHHRGKDTLQSSKISAFGTGRRKRTSAFAMVTSPGTGRIFINRRELVEYFEHFCHRNDIVMPVYYAKKLCEVDVRVYAHGGGHTGQAYASKIAIAKALKKLFPKMRENLKKNGMLRYDPRSVESKKMGMPKARKDHAYVRR